MSLMRWSNKYNRARAAFTLIEVVLAIGIFLVTVLALVGLLGPTLQSVDEVEKTDEVASVVNTVNAFLQNSPEIATSGDSKFEAIYKAVEDGGHATLFVYRWYEDDGGGNKAPNVRLEIGFGAGENGNVGADSIVNSVDATFADAAGPIYRVVLTPSSVIPEDHVTDNGEDAYPRYSLEKPVSSDDPTDSVYPEGYFAMEVRIFAEDPPGPNGTFDQASDLAALADREPLFTYNTAVVR